MRNWNKCEVCYVPQARIRNDRTTCKTNQSTDKTYSKIYKSSDNYPFLRIRVEKNDTAKNRPDYIPIDFEILGCKFKILRAYMIFSLTVHGRGLQRERRMLNLIDWLSKLCWENLGFWDRELNELDDGQPTWDGLPFRRTGQTEALQAWFYALETESGNV